MLIVGDVHGKIDQFWSICLDYWEKNPQGKVIQLGDVGFHKSYEKLIKLFRNTYAHKGLLTIVPGNHDDYARCIESRGSSKWKYTGGIKIHNTTSQDDMFFQRGANSIDKHLRTEGIDWFSNEEMSYTQLGKAVDLYIESKPRIMFSHTCPSSVKKQLFSYDESSRTEQALQVMWELHQPEYWFFGHFHTSRNETMVTDWDNRFSPTQFICLAELETFEL